MWKCGFVHRGPAPVPGVVAQEARLLVSLFLDGSGGEEHLEEVLDHLVGQHHPEFIFDEVCKFVLHKLCMFGCRVVAAVFDAAVLLLHGPWGRGRFGRDAMVPPVSKEGGDWVIDVVEVRGQVGRASELGYKGLPGQGGGKVFT